MSVECMGALPAGEGYARLS